MKNTNLFFLLLNIINDHKIKRVTRIIDESFKLVTDQSNNEGKKATKIPVKPAIFSVYDSLIIRKANTAFKEPKIQLTILELIGLKPKK